MNDLALNDKLSERQKELIKEAHFTGPPEEDPLIQTLCHPLTPIEKESSEEQKKTEKEREFLKVVVDHESKDPAILWFGLFTDLIFVAIIVQFANQYKHFFKYRVREVDDQGTFYARITAETILFFFAFFTIWLELAQANVRFINIAGAVDDTLYFCYLVGVIIMAVQMSEEDYLLDHHAGFLAGLLLCVVSMFLLHVAYYRSIPRAREYCKRRFFSYGLASLLISIGLILGSVLEEKAAQWISAIIVAFSCIVICIVSFISFRVDPRYYNHSFDYFEERFGVLVMIVTGESILALILGDRTGEFLYTDEGGFYLNSYDYPVYAYKGAFLQYSTSQSVEENVCTCVAFATMYILKNIYFGSEADYAEHALNERDVPGSVIWVGMHFPLTFSLLGCGIGYKLVFTAIHDGEGPLGYRLILGVCVMMSIISMLIIRAAHDKFLFVFKSMIIRIPTALCIPIGCALIDNVIGYVVWTFAFTCLSWFWDLTIMESLEIKKYNHTSSHGGGHEDTDSHDHGDTLKHVSQESLRDHIEDATAFSTLLCDEAGCWHTFLTICGLHDLEYAGAFHGPEYEGDPRQLCFDSLSCTIWSASRSVKGIFPEEYVERMAHHGHGHGHGGDDHGHGHGDDHGHGGDEAGEAHGWFGVFTDLIFVAVIIKFADQMKYRQTSMNLKDAELVQTNWEHAKIYLEAAVFFGGFFICWLELQHLLIRFTNMPGIFDDIMYFLYLSGVIGMAIQMNHLEYFFENRQGFCLWLSFSLLCLVVLHLKLRQIDIAEEYCMHRVVTFGISFSLTFTAAFLDEPSTAILLIFSYLNILWVSLNSFRVWEESVPDPHLQFEYIERFGLIIMITTGESILALIIGEFEQDLEHYAMILLAFLTMYIFKTIYFDSHSEEPSMHALAEGHIPGAVMWAFLHLPASFFLLGCGVGYKMLTSYARESYVEPINRYTLGVSITGALWSIYMIRASHAKFVLPPISVAIRFSTAALAPVGAVFIEAPLGYVGWCCAVVCLCYALDWILLHWLGWEIHPDHADFMEHGFYKQGIFEKYYREIVHATDTHDHEDPHGHKTHGHHEENEMTPLTITNGDPDKNTNTEHSAGESGPEEDQGHTLTNTIASAKNHPTNDEEVHE